MKIQYFRTLWGVTEPLERFLPSLVERGFTGIETSPMFHTKEQNQLFHTQLPCLGLRMIVLCLTSGPDVASHLKSLREQIEVALHYNPVKINVHGGFFICFPSFFC